MTQLKQESLNKIDFTQIQEVNIYDIPSNIQYTGAYDLDKIERNGERSIIGYQNETDKSGLHKYIMNFITTDGVNTISQVGYNEYNHDVPRRLDSMTDKGFLYFEWENPIFENVGNEPKTVNYSFDLLITQSEDIKYDTPLSGVEGRDYILTSTGSYLLYGYYDTNGDWVDDASTQTARPYWRWESIVGKQTVNQVQTVDLSQDVIIDSNLQEKAKPVIEEKVNNKFGLPTNANVVQVEFDTGSGNCNLLGYQDIQARRNLNEVERIDGQSLINKAVTNTLNKTIQENPDEIRNNLNAVSKDEIDSSVSKFIVNNKNDVVKNLNVVSNDEIDSKVDNKIDSFVKSKPEQVRGDINAASKDDLTDKIAVPSGSRLVNVEFKGKINGEGSTRTFNMLAFEEVESRRVLEERIESLKKEKKALQGNHSNLKNVGKEKRKKIAEIDEAIESLEETCKHNNASLQRHLEENGEKIDGNSLLYNNVVEQASHDKGSFRNAIDTKKSSDVVTKTENYSFNIPASIVGGVIGGVIYNFTKNVICKKRANIQNSQANLENSQNVDHTNSLNNANIPFDIEGGTNVALPNVMVQNTDIIRVHSAVNRSLSNSSGYQDSINNQNKLYEVQGGGRDLS